MILIVQFAVVCQQYHVSYYLTATSCGGIEGWSQVFSSSPQFALWARDVVKIPVKFSTYIHGKDAAKEIDKKPQQPSDERKTRLGHVLNDLVGKQSTYLQAYCPNRSDFFYCYR